MASVDKITYIFGAIIGILAPTTNVLTAVLVYYRHREFIWFGFSIGFVIFPAIFFSFLYVGATVRNKGSYAWIRDLAAYGNPFAPGLYRLKLFIWCCKNKKEIVAEEKAANDELDGEDKGVAEVREVDYEAFLGLTAAIFQALPQTILESYVIFAESSREIQIIQIFSLSFSFLNFLYGLTSWETNHIRRLPGVRLKLAHRTTIIIYNVLLLSARMIAIVCFTFRYTYVIMFCLIAHWIIWIAVDWNFALRSQHTEVETFISYYYLLPLFLLTFIDNYEALKISRRLLLALLYHILFAVFNMAVIVAFYSATGQSGRYELSLVVVVFVASVLGSLLRIVLILKRSRNSVTPS